MLIVIVVLGIMAMIIVPQVTISSNDATLRTFETNLNNLRKVVELYYNQHDNNYPGFHDENGAPATTAIVCKKAFEEQLLKYTAIDGAVSDTKDTTHKFGPYIRGGVLPTNPYNGKSKSTCDPDEADITVRVSDKTAGWKFYPKTGVLIADDGAHDNF